MATTWPSPGPSNCFLLTNNQCGQGYSMPNFTILGVSNSALFLEMAKIWPFYGQNWSSSGPSNRFFLNHNQNAQG